MVVFRWCGLYNHILLTETLLVSLPLINYSVHQILTTMKIKWGSLAVDGRGKIGGHVASKNRAGAYIRTKVTPVNPQTLFQSAVRAAFTAFSQAWRTLSDSQRLAWDSAVSDWGTTDIFGDIRNPTGKNLYQKLNMLLSTIGQPSVSVPYSPTTSFLAPDYVLAADFGTQTVSIDLDTYTVPIGATMIVEATPGISRGKSFVKGKYRVLATFPATTTGVVDISAAYIARFGSVVADKNVWVAVKIVSSTTPAPTKPKVSHADAGR